jgi:Mg2+ and Co2+ transporter CorA
MIRLARASRSDSNTMKAITILTMVFLPATFVCSLFSMGFFDFTAATTDEDDSNLGPPHHRTMRVAGQFWIYFAVAVPLTILVLGMCAAWLQWSARQEEDGGGDKVGAEARGVVL